jgi:hypothetical protein
MVLVCFCLTLSSCGFFKTLFASSGGGPTEPANPAAADAAVQAPTQLVGEVASVHAEEGFVLIRRFGGGGLPQGYVFHSSNASGETTSLRPTGERLGKFYAADITAGTPEAGDFVLARRLPEAAAAPSIPTTEPKKPGLNFP